MKAKVPRAITKYIATATASLRSHIVMAYHNHLWLTKVYRNGISVVQSGTIVNIIL